MAKLSIWYHGTNERAAAEILLTGFKIGSYFAAHLEDAIGFGGEYVFGVATDWKDLRWQVTCREVILPSKIVHLRRYIVQELQNNETLGKAVFKSNLETSL